MKIKLLLALCLLMAGCAGSQYAGYSGTKQITLNVAPYDEVIKAQREFSGNDTSHRGYAIWEQDKCTIWIVPEDYFVSEEIWHALLGHELRHCFFGAFHK